MALATTAPLESVTVPEMIPPTAECIAIGKPKTSIKIESAVSVKNKDVSFMDFQMTHTLKA
jgi:hypothetical protein